MVDKSTERTTERKRWVGDEGAQHRRRGRRPSKAFPRVPGGEIHALDRAPTPTRRNRRVLTNSPVSESRGHHFMHHVHDRMTARRWRSRVSTLPWLSMTYLCMSYLNDRHPKVTPMHPRRC